MPEGAVPPLDSGISSNGSTPDAGATDSATVSEGGVVDAGNDAAMGPHAALPTVVDLGGTLLTSPKVQLIVYTEDPLATQCDDMATELTQTSTWSAQTSEYGVGALTKQPTIQIAGTPPTTLDDQTGNPTPFQQTLISNLTGASPAWGAPNPSTIYAFVLPAGTNIESDGSCCTDFYGYHYEVEVSNGVYVPYAIICDCTSPTGDPLTPLQNVTTTISHELVEAATDPFSNTSAAYAQEDNGDLVWTYATGGEIADMCQYNADSNYTPSGSTYMVQRSWSNAAASAGTNPCVPVPPIGPFFESMAVLSDMVTVSLYGQSVTTRGVHIPVGSSATIDVQLYSDAATSGPWSVTAYDLGYYLGGGPSTPYTTVSLDKTSGSNGDVLHLTIHVNSADPNLQGEGFVLESDLGGQQNLTFGAVGN